MWFHIEFSFKILPRQTCSIGKLFHCVPKLFLKNGYYAFYKSWQFPFDSKFGWFHFSVA